MLSDGVFLPPNKLRKTGKGGKRGFYDPWAHVSTEGEQEKQAAFQEESKLFASSCPRFGEGTPSCAEMPADINEYTNDMDK